MATGTGKTKTCIALIYRLLKAQRFKRVLFLVDRSALGEQAANTFKDTRMENLQTFADIFGIKELEDQRADTDTAVHIATIQGMVQRILYAGENAVPPAIDEYDCIIIGKEAFRVFDAVQLYDALEKVTAMKPVVVNPQISFGQLAAEMQTVTDDEARSLIRDQFVATPFPV